MSNNASKRSNMDLIITFGPAILLVITGFWFAYQFVAPPPPKKFVITTGSKSGTYDKIAQQYREEPAKEGIELEIVSSSDPGENISRLINKEADLAFIQGGTGKDEPGLYSLGSLYYEPLWIFLGKHKKIEQIADLSNLNIAIGKEGSGTRILAKQILKLNHIENSEPKLFGLSPNEAAEALLQSKIAADIIVASIESASVQQLLRNEQLELLDLQRADAYIRLIPYLSKVTLPEGVIDLEKNIPDQPITMLSASANLVVSEGFNPALIVLLLRAADVIHSKASVFSAAGTFPSAEFTAYPINEIADRFYKVGPPLLMRYLPFWPAVFIDRMIVMLVPLLALLLSLGKIMPPLYRWRIRSKIYRWYKDLQEVADIVHRKQPNVVEFVQINRNLAQIEDQVNKVKTPMSYANQAYNLLIHIDLVRKKLYSKNPETYS